LEPSGVFIAVEIEDSNPLSEEKLFRYCELYDALDYCDCGGLRLFVFDRYGLNERELDLCELYLNGLVEKARLKRVAPAPPAVNRGVGYRPPR
jgi:hypothetical protein